MARTRTTHSTEEWMELITECRRSGMSDADWCRQNNIPTSSFYNAVCRLRKKACEIPVPSDDTAGRIVNPAAGSPDVVPIRIEP